MAKKKFILQGLTTSTHRDAVLGLFDVSGIQKVTFSVAFVTDSAVQLIESKLKVHAAKATVFAGIRNDLTSYQALARLHGIGCTLYAVDTGSRGVLFHPKIFLVRGNAKAALLMGSANLTLGGLNNNIEAGMLFDLDLSDASDKAIVENIEAEFTTLPTDHAENVIEIDSVALLDEMLAAGRLVDEMAMPPPRPTTTASADAKDAVTRILLKVPMLRRPLAPASATPKSKVAVTSTTPTIVPTTTPAKTPTPAAPAVAAPTTAAPAVSTTPPATASPGVDLELVWESKALTRRDLGIPDAYGTHATGSINLDKGLLPESVDHRHYFREEVFAHLHWSPANATVDQAYATFQLVLKGVSHGEFELRIGHTTSTTSASYNQNNAMTRLSWGPMRDSVGKEDLIGRTLALYRDKSNPARFVLEID